MTLARTLALFLAGGIVGAVTIVACGDDSPDDADAQTTCDCPAAEPPLTGRVVHRSTTEEIPPTAITGFAGGCEDGEILISGGCTQSTGAPVVLVENGPATSSESTWVCRWNNADTNAAMVTATAICLQPAAE